MRKTIFLCLILGGLACGVGGQQQTTNVGAGPTVIGGGDGGSSVVGEDGGANCAVYDDAHTVMSGPGEQCNVIGDTLYLCDLSAGYFCAGATSSPGATPSPRKCLQMCDADSPVCNSGEDCLIIEPPVRSCQGYTASECELAKVCSNFARTGVCVGKAVSTAPGEPCGDLVDGVYRICVNGLECIAEAPGETVGICGTPCDLFVSNCASGEVCADTGKNHGICVPEGFGLAGRLERCETKPCAEDLVCIEEAAGGRKWCFEICDPAGEECSGNAGQCTCLAGETCYPINPDAAGEDAPKGACIPVAATAYSKEGEQCLTQQCEADLYCVANLDSVDGGVDAMAYICFQGCDPAAGGGCAAGKTCSEITPDMVRGEATTPGICK